MSKKHFVALANVLAANKIDAMVCKLIATICANANVNFDRRRFLIACGLDPREI